MSLKNFITNEIRKTLMTEAYSSQEVIGKIILGKPIVDKYFGEAYSPYEKQLGYFLGGDDDCYIVLKNLEYNEKIGKYIVTPHTYIIYNDDANDVYKINDLDPYSITDEKIEEAIFNTKAELNNFYKLLKNDQDMRLSFKTNFDKVITKDFKVQEKKTVDLKRYESVELEYHRDIYTLADANFSDDEYQSNIRLDFESKGESIYDTQHILININFSYDIMGKVKDVGTYISHTASALSKYEHIAPNEQMKAIVKDILKQLK